MLGGRISSHEVYYSSLFWVEGAKYVVD